MAGPLPVNILCGYLGAGKTTLLNHLLTRATERVLVMVNDFGDVPVDASLIARQTADTIQLSNGCICCSMGGGLFDAFDRALSLRGKVDRLVIEASGVAEPRRLASFALAERDLDCQAVLAVVDPLCIAERLADPRTGQVARRQILGADALFLSRADIAGRVALRRAARLLAGMNPLASQHLAPDGVLDQALRQPHDFNALSALHPADDRDGDHRNLFASRTLRLSGPVDRQHLLAAISRHQRGIHRLKGYLRLSEEALPQLLQLAGGVVTLVPVEAAGELPMDRVVAIGPDAGCIDALQAELAGQEVRVAATREGWA
ncbi:CobW family GTP-binding protein [Paracoccus sp. KR1-242]|uniref:CobW family GTP-binding protein n=1 Tax=Paracoccus sp. KR1-242 TaxID=3410028 RepID=UPI003BFA85DB